MFQLVDCCETSITEESFCFQTVIVDVDRNFQNYLECCAMLITV